METVLFPLVWELECNWCRFGNRRDNFSRVGNRGVTGPLFRNPKINLSWEPVKGELGLGLGTRGD